MTNCKNCGAPLPSYPCKCEYCGTEYYDGIRDIGNIDEQDEECLYADDKLIARVTSAGLVTLNEARRKAGFNEVYGF